MTTSESSLSIQYISTEESFIDVKSTVEIPFDFRESKQVKVKENDEHLIEGQDYEVLIGLEKDDNVTHYSYKKVYGYVRMLKDIPINNILTLYRETPKTQESEYRMHRRLDVQNIENSFDKVTMITQELGSDSDEIREDLTEAQTDILELEDRASVVETRATALEAGLTSAQSDIDDTKKRVKKAEGIVSDMHDTVSSFDSRVTDLEADAVVTRERVTYTELKSNTNDSRITRLEETAVTKDEIPDINTKQDVLVSGENIKTINDMSILGSGNIIIEGGGGVDDYPSLTDKPSINGVEINGAMTSEDLGITAENLGVDNKVTVTYYQTSNTATKTFDEIYNLIINNDYVDLDYKYSENDTTNVKYVLSSWSTSGIDFRRTNLATNYNTVSYVKFKPDGISLYNEAYQIIGGTGIQITTDRSNMIINNTLDISGKQDVINDLTTIRSNAQKGSQAYAKVPKNGDIIYTFRNQGGYVRSTDKTIKKIAGDYILCTDGSVFCITYDFKYNQDLTEFTDHNHSHFFVTDQGKDVISDGKNSYYLTTHGGLYQRTGDRYGTGDYDDTLIADGVKEFKCSQTTMWYLDYNNNLWGKGDNLCNQQGMTLDEIKFEQDNENWSGLFYVEDFYVRAENVEEFGCTEFATYYKKDGKYYLAGLCNTSIQTQTTISFKQNTDGFTEAYSINDITDISFGCYISNTGSDYKHNVDMSEKITEMREQLIRCLDSRQDDGSFTQVSGISTQLHLRLIHQFGDHFIRYEYQYGIGDGFRYTISMGEYTCAYFHIPVLSIDFQSKGTTTIANPMLLLSYTTTTDYKDVKTCGATIWYINNSGALYGLGLNNYGQQGSGNTTDVSGFTARESDEEVVKVYCDYGNTYYLTLSGTLYGTGYNYNGLITKHLYYSTSDTSNTRAHKLTKFIKIADNVRDFDILNTNIVKRYDILNSSDRYLYWSLDNYTKALTYFTKDNKAYRIYEHLTNRPTTKLEGTSDDNLYNSGVRVDKLVTKTMEITNTTPYICDNRALTVYFGNNLKNTTRLYRLLNTKTEHYHQDLWTSDPYICDKETGDISKLYRRIRIGEGKKYWGFCNIQEDITISRGDVTSASGFYDSHYAVSLDDYFDAGNDRIWYSRYQNGETYSQICTTNQKNYYAERPVDYINVGGANNIYAVNDNIKISDSRWHVGVASNTELRIGEQSTGAWVQTSFVHSANISTIYNENLFSMELDFVTPSVFSGTPHIVNIYRTLGIRANNANGDVVIYMAGYKSSSSLKWRHSGISANMSIKTNTKYHLKFYTSDNKTDNAELANNYEYTMELTAYDKYGNITDDTKTFTFTSAYLPCNYYSNTVSNSMSTLMTAETVATGMLLDLDSVVISYGTRFKGVDNWTCYQPCLHTTEVQGQSFIGGSFQDTTILPDLCEDSKLARLEF
jgi:hypothetical protein